MSRAHSDKIFVVRPMEGYWQQILSKDGRIIEVSPWRKNLIVNKIGELLAWFLKVGQTSGPNGVQYYAVGSGLASWDGTNVAPDMGDTQLTTEIAGSRKVPAITYLDSNDVPTTTKTDVIEMEVSYAEGELLGTTWREFALFGGNGTTAVNSGYMINHVIHGAFPKTSIAVARKTRFRF